MSTVALGRFVVRETLVSGAASMVLSIAIAWLMFHTVVPLSLWGANGIAIDLLISSCAIGLLMTATLTLAVRARKARAGTSELPDAPANRIIAWLSGRALLTRALALGFLAMATMAPAGLGILLVLGIDSLDLPALLAGKAVQGLVIGLGLTPVIILAELGKSVKRDRSAIG